MDIDDILKETLEEMLKHLDVEYTKIEIDEEEDNFNINIKSDNPSLLIGYHGENIQALQHLIKVLSYKRVSDDKKFHITLDVDDYKKRQEENVIALATRLVDKARQTGRPQSLPPMSAYFRKKIHTHLMGAGYDDVETESRGEADRRHVVIKIKG